MNNYNNIHNIPIYPDSVLIDFEADVIIPSNKAEFKYMWENKIFDFMKHNSDNSMVIVGVHFDVPDEDWIFENRHALSYISAQDLWRSSPEFFKLNTLVYTTLSKDCPNIIINMDSNNDAYKGVRLDKKWDFTNKNSDLDLDLYIKNVQMFCKIAEYSDIIRTGKYMPSLLHISKQILFLE